MFELKKQLHERIATTKFKVLYLDKNSKQVEKLLLKFYQMIKERDDMHLQKQTTSERIRSQKRKKAQSQCKNTIASKQQGLGLPVQGISYKFLQIFKNFITSPNIFHSFCQFQNAFITFFGTSTCSFLKNSFKVFNHYLMLNLTQGYGMLMAQFTQLIQATSLTFININVSQHVNLHSFRFITNFENVSFK